MSLQGSNNDRPEAPSPVTVANGAVAAGNKGNGTVLSSLSLRLNPNQEHKPDDYEDMQLEFSAVLLSSLEKYLPPTMLNDPRDQKAKFMQDILLKYLPPTERNRAIKHREYRQKIISNYQPRNRELYTLNPTAVFVPSFLKAIHDNSEQSFRNILSEPSPGIFVFEMLQKDFCESLLEEIENFENWVTEAKFRIMRPNTMNRYGAVLEDFGFETMLDMLMEGFIRPLSRVFFAEVGGSTLDSHHGFVVEYGQDRDVDLGFHVDDSEVTLNVCLGKQFSGGELFFRGTRCENHVNTDTQSEGQRLKQQESLLPSGFVKALTSVPFCIFHYTSYMSMYGAVLEDFGFETMLDMLMEGFIRPLSRVFFAEVGGSTLDSHHGFVVEYGQDRDVDLGFHVDDSEVTLNVCLGKQFSGGELFFRGTRCENHVNTDTQSEEIFDYSHAPGQAVLHRGRHRHGARATTSGHRVNLLLWCRSSVFREMKRYQKDFPSWCDECNREKKERQRSSLATRMSVVVVVVFVVVALME
ncbi:hypothetical protein TanjilG_06110 [Lupinus angustifolius]|uniref:Fe2OG dioxygenase domain-containing protein n=1 Tax=Lupinus angustifolius TaxID=3871 RepID=A0A1J7HMK0_LUPAN|nr:hypothetical protein TanjilG_06110 [Lupinus angustifolius]